MRDESRAMGARFAIVTLSNGLQVYPDGGVRARRLKELGIEDPFYPDHRIKRLGDIQGFPVLSLAPLMIDTAQARHLSLHGFPNGFPNSGHWNEEGHRLAGELLARWICGLLGDHANSEPERLLATTHP